LTGKDVSVTEQATPHVILLAAGGATRLGDALDASHKCLVEVGGRAIVDYQLAPLAAAGRGTPAVAVAVGYQAAVLRAELLRRYPEVAFTFVENRDYAETNTIWSLYLAREPLAAGALLFNADVVMDPRIIERLLAADASKSWLAVTRSSCAEEEVKVVVDGAGRVTRVGKALEPSACAGEFIGAARFSAACGERYVRELEQVAAEHRRSFFEFALDRILGETEVCMLDVTDLPCIEVDFPEDLERARREIAPLIAARGASHA
jgi:choline kinase